MQVNGFPNQGHDIEIKASAMEAKIVEIITGKGATYAQSICGLEQGNPDSPTVSNLVIKLMHDVWGSSPQKKLNRYYGKIKRTKRNLLCLILLIRSMGN